MTTDQYINALARIQADRHAELIAAEEACKQACEAPLEPRINYPNTNYWDRVGPWLDAKRLSWRNEDILKVLDDTCDEITLRYQALMDALGEPE